MRGKPSRPRNPPGGEVAVAWSVPRRFLCDFEIRACVRAALEHGRRPGIDVSVALVSDAELAAIHGRFLADPSPTDVISFELGDEGEGPSAEICVSVERAAAVARRRGITPASELRLYLVHGALHLCGFDDRDPRTRARMRRAEARVLRALARPTPPRDGTRGPRPDGKTGKTSSATGASAGPSNARGVSAGKQRVSRSRARSR
jgi:probable rRNA maturation factor